MFSPDEITATVDSYVTYALWATTDNTPDDDPLDYNYGPEDISPEAMAKIREDVTQFLESNAETIEAIRELPQNYALKQLGHDLFLTRNGHGTGFWDRGLGNLGEALSDAAHDMGASDLYVGDDGKIYAE